MPGASEATVQPGAESTETTTTTVETTESSELEAGAAKGQEGDDFSDPERAKAEIKKLRAENAKHRNRSKALEEKMSALDQKFSGMKKALGVEREEEDPMQTIENLKTQNEALEMEIAFSNVARSNNIPAEGEKYFRFLLNERLVDLEEGAELSEEEISEVAGQVTSTLRGKQNSTGLQAAKPDSTGAGGLSVDQFAKMSLGEKSALYARNQNEYARLFAEANARKLI